MNQQTNQSTGAPGQEQWQAFQGIWADTINKMFQLGMTFPQENTPPEFVRQVRSSIFQAMAQAWEEFLRSPQFLDGMKQWMDSAIAFRQLNKDTLTRVHQEMQIPSTQDIDAVLVSVRRVEQRLTRQIEELSARMDATTAHAKPKAPARKNNGSGKRQPRGAATRKAAGGKV